MPCNSPRAPYAHDQDQQNQQDRYAPSLSIDWERYGEMLEASDWSDEQKREFIACLWSIVVAFVDLGFNVHPVQLALADRACGQDDLAGALRRADLLNSCGEEQPHAE